MLTGEHRPEFPWLEVPKLELCGTAGSSLTASVEIRYRQQGTSAVAVLRATAAGRGTFVKQNRLWQRLATTVIVVLAGTAANAADFREIVLDSHTLKWGQPVAGTGATVSYAVADKAASFAGAINCPAIVPLDRILTTNGISRTTLDHELDAALAAWSRVANIRFVKAAPETAQLLVGAQATPNGRAFTNVEYADPGRPAGQASLTRSVICLNPQERWKIGFDGNLDVYDIRYTLTHEIGHAIGLDHPGRTGELMDFRYTEQFRVPQTGDIAGADFLYGPNPAPAQPYSVALRTKVGQAGESGVHR